MRTVCRWLVIAVTGAMLAGMPLRASAQLGIWTGAGADSNWTTVGNWFSNTPPSNGAAGIFIYESSASTGVSNVDVPWTLGALVVDAAAPQPLLLTGAQISIGGALDVSRAGTVIANPLAIGFAVQATINADATLTGALSGGGFLLKQGAAKLILAGPTMHSGPTFIVAGTLAIGNGIAGPASVGDIVVDSALEFAVPGGVTVGAVSGSGTVTVFADGVVTSGAPFHHQGTTTIANGALMGGAIDNNARLQIDLGGEFATGGSTIGSLSGAGTLSLNGELWVGGDNALTTFDGPIVGPGFIRKLGMGSLALGGAFSGGGGNAIIEGGTLQFGNGATGPPTVGDILTNAEASFCTPAGVTAGAITGTGLVTVLCGGLTSLTPLTHAGMTTIGSSGELGASIVNNALLNIAAGGDFSTGGSTVGSLLGAGNVFLNGPLEVGGDGTDTLFTGPILGPGAIEKVGAGRLIVAGALGSGGAVVTGGTLQVGDGTNGSSTMGDIVTNATIAFDVPTGITVGAVTGSGSLILLGGLLTTSGAPLLHAGPTTIAGGNMGATITNNALLTIAAGGILDTGGSTVGSLAGAGTLNLNGGPVAAGGDDTSTTFSGVLGSTGTLEKSGTGTLTLSGASTNSGGLLVNAGRVLLTGSLAGPVTVMSGATFGGTGTVNGAVTVNTGGTLAPGLSPGQTNVVGNVVLAGILLQEIEGTTLGTQYDNLNVTGSVNVSGGALVLAGAYVPLAGDTFEVITNDGADPVIGTFVGLAEGATGSFNGVTVRISYVGGDGNDVVLTALAAAPPVGGAPRIPTLSAWMLVLLAGLMLLATRFPALTGRWG